MDLHLIHGSLDPHESAPNDISIGSAIFAQITRVPNIATDHIYALRAGDAAF